jgi:uncharacterized protein (TIGR00255 family)
MTGFGRTELQTSLGTIAIEARSENHRYLDINYQLPDSLTKIENNIAEIVKKYISRGKFRINITAKLNNKGSHLDGNLAKNSLIMLEKLKKDLKINGETKLEHLLMLKDLFTTESDEEFNKNDLNKILNGLKSVIKKVHETRKQEGKYLKTELLKRIGKIEKLLGKIKARRQSFPKETKDKLKERVNLLLEDSQIEQSRLVQEIAILAEKSDFTEETVRLNAHIKRFKDTMNKNTPVGRELDFLVQEMNREAGTISAKSKDARISHYIIELRSDLEKIREQIQNVE